MWLYRFEAKGIQEFILATDKLTEIAGASRIVDAFSEKLSEKGSVPGQVISYAAGFIEIEFKTLSDLQSVAGTLPFALQRLAPGLSFAHAWVQKTSDKNKDREILNQRLSASRNHPLISLPEAPPVVQRSSQTGLPAVKMKDGMLLDKGSSARQEAYKDDDFFADLLSKKLSRKVKIPSDLTQLAGNGELALLHADGNGVGALIQGGGVRDFEAFSKSLSQATQNAFLDATQSIIAISSQDIPLRPIILGGDDLTVILRASDALAFTIAYLKAFEKHTSTLQGLTHQNTHLTACAGLVFIKSKWPFYQAHTIAEDLCKASKKALRTQGPTPSGLLFHRITTSLVEDWDAILKHELKDGQLSYGPYRLIGQPTLEGIEHLKNNLSTLNRGAFREWLRLLKIDPEAAKKHWNRLVEVQKKKYEADWKTFSRTLEALGVNPLTGCNDQQKTPIADALALRALARPE